MPEPDAKSLKALHQQALDQFQLVVETEKDQRARELEDLQFDAGDQWPAEVQQARQGMAGGQGQPSVPARPMITIRTLDQPTAQIINQARNARFAIKITAKSDAGEDDAEVRQGLIRAIEYDSHAQTAYLWAYMRAVIAGRGYFRINKTWAHDDPDDLSGDPSAWDQDLKIDLILNGASVYVDPWAQALNDPSAAEWAMVTEDLPEATYKRDYPKTKLAGMNDGELTSLGDQKDVWIKTGDKGQKSYRIAERFYTVYDTRTETNPHNKDQTREVRTRRVMWGKLNGVEWIEPPQEWDGKFIPIIPVLGVEKNVGGKRLWEGLVRPNIGPCRMINYLVSSDAENMGLATKAPWIGYAGQFEGYEEQWTAANTRNQPWLEANATTDKTGSQVLPLPERNIPQYPPSSEAIGMYVNFVRSTTGVPDAALGHVNANDKSGKAIQQLQQASEQGTSNFPDNLMRAIQHAGVVLLDLLPHIYDRPGRIARIIEGDDDAQSSVMLNAPFVRQQGEPQPAPPGSVPGQPAPGMPPQQPQQPPGPQGPPPGGPGPMPPMPPMVEHYDLSKGSFSCVVEVGKAFATQKGEERDSLLALAQIVPEAVPRFLDLLVKAIGGPNADAIAERVKPPGTDDNLPPQVQAAIGQMQQENQQLKMALATKQVETQAKLEEAQMNVQGRIKVAEIGAQTSLVVAEVAASTKVKVADLESRIAMLETMIGVEKELRLQQQAHVHEHSIQGHSQAHEAGVTAQQHAHDLEQATQAHEQGLEAGDQGHQQALEQMAAQPQPEAEA